MLELTIRELREHVSAVLEHAELIDVRVSSTSAKCAHPTAAGPFTVATDVGIRGIQRDGAIDCWAKYEVVATADDPEIEAWRVGMEMVGTWITDDSVPVFDATDLTSFAAAIGSMALHPYARAFIQNQVGQMGYPPFTLDMLLPITQGPDEEIVSFETEDDRLDEDDNPETDLVP